MEIIPSKRFIIEAKKLLNKNPPYKIKLEKTLNLLKTNPHHPSLRLHKLSGFQNFSASVDKSIRIILHLQDEKIFLLKIGTHDEVY